jgi:hypothetical protein
VAAQERLCLKQFSEQQRECRRTELDVGWTGGGLHDGQIISLRISGISGIETAATWKSPPK